jgi:hypothetical protein
LSSKLSLVTVTTQVCPDPLISESRKVLCCRTRSRWLPVSVGRRLRGAQAATGGGDALAVAVAAVVLGATDAVVLGTAVLLCGLLLAAPVASADGLAEAEGDALGLGLGVGEGLSAATCVGGGGRVWTAEPLLVPFTISAMITATIATATPTMASRRTQYV